MATGGYLSAMYRPPPPPPPTQAPHLRIHVLHGSSGGSSSSGAAIPVATPGGSLVDITQTLTAAGTPHVAESPGFGGWGAEKAAGAGGSSLRRAVGTGSEAV